MNNDYVITISSWEISPIRKANGYKSGKMMKNESNKCVGSRSPLKPSGKPSRKVGIPEEQGTFQETAKDRKKTCKSRDLEVEGIPRSKEKDNPETEEPSKRKNHNNTRYTRLS